MSVPALEGWWFAESRTQLTVTDDTTFGVTYLGFDLQNEIAFLYTGSSDQAYAANQSTGKYTFGIWSTADPNSFILLIFTITEPLKVVIKTQITLSVDKTRLFFTGDDLSVYRRLCDAPTILNPEAAPVQWNSPVAQVNNFLSYLNTNVLCYVPKNIKPTDYDYDRIFSIVTGYVNGKSTTYSASVRDFARTNGLDREILLTGVDCTDVHPFTPASRVEISGLKGRWACLNGCHQLIPFGIANYQPPLTFFDYKTARNRFYINFNTRDLPKYREDQHGCAIVTSTVGPITNSSNYREMMAVIFDTVRMMVYTTHSSIEYFIIKKYERDRWTLRIVENYHEITGTAPHCKIYRATYGKRNVGPTSVINYSCPFDYKSALEHVDYCSPDDIDPIIDPYWRYNITYNNYLEPDTVARVWWKISGPCNETNLTYFGYPNNGSKFEFRASQKCPGRGWQPVGGPDGPLYFGLIKLDKTRPDVEQCDCKRLICGCSKRIGYVMLSSFILGDPYLFIDDPAFGPPETNYIALFSAMIEYLQSLDIVTLIVDVRKNDGGPEAAMFALAQVFGDCRQGFFKYLPLSGDGTAAALWLHNRFDLGVPKQSDKLATVKTTEKSLSNMDVYVMTSTETYGTCAAWLHLMMGDGLDGNLGNDCVTKMIGAMDGRFHGFPSGLYEAPRPSAINNQLSLNGVSISAFRYTFERVTPYLARNSQLPTTLYDRTMKPRRELPIDWGMYSRDVGFYGEADPQDSATWHDTWVDKVISAIIGKKSE